MGDKHMAQLHFLRGTRIWTCIGQIRTLSYAKLGAVATSLLKKRQIRTFAYSKLGAVATSLLKNRQIRTFSYSKRGAVATSLLKTGKFGLFLSANWER